jgi:hypothetical protein
MLLGRVQLKTYLYVVSLVVVTTFTEKSVVHNTVNVELVEQGVAVLHLLALNVNEIAVTYLGDGCSKDNNFIKLTNALHELIHAWSLDDVNVVVLAFYFNGNGEVCLMQDLTAVSTKQTGERGGARERTLKLLCTKVSSKSSTKHFLPLNRGAIGPRRYFCGSEASDISAVCL